MLATGLDKLSSIVIIIMFKSVIQNYQDNILSPPLTAKKIEHYDMFISQSLRGTLLAREMTHFKLALKESTISYIVSNW